MDLLGDLNTIWVDVASVFLMLSFLIFVVFLIWQHLKNKKEQDEILKQYESNLKILNDLRNRF